MEVGGSSFPKRKADLAIGGRLPLDVERLAGRVDLLGGRDGDGVAGLSRGNGGQTGNKASEEGRRREVHSDGDEDVVCACRNECRELAMRIVL